MGNPEDYIELCSIKEALDKILALLRTEIEGALPKEKLVPLTSPSIYDPNDTVYNRGFNTALEQVRASLDRVWGVNKKYKNYKNKDKSLPEATDNVNERRIIFD
jgi:hypothetical protein